jgi:hypothetical protein
VLFASRLLFPKAKSVQINAASEEAVSANEQREFAKAA